MNLIFLDYDCITMKWTLIGLNWTVYCNCLDDVCWDLVQYE